MFNLRGMVVLSPIAKLDKNKSKSFFHYFRSPECAHKQDHKKKLLYF